MQIKRTEVDEVRTIFWIFYSCIKAKQESAFKLGQIIESDKYKRCKEDGIPYSNRFFYFESGAHTPRPDLIEKVEVEAPGSSYIINMPLWQTFNQNFDAELALRIISKLPANVRGKANIPPDFQLNRKLPQYRPEWGKRLVRLGTYDALCMLMVFWRLDVEQLNHPNRRSISLNIYHLLLVLSDELPCYKVSERFFLLFKHYVFDHASSDGYKFDLTWQKFAANAQILNQFFPAAEKSNEKNAAQRHTTIGAILQKPSKFPNLYSILNNVYDVDETGPLVKKIVYLEVARLNLNAKCAYMTLFGHHDYLLTKHRC